MANYAISIPVWRVWDSNYPKPQNIQISLFQGEGGSRTLDVTFLEKDKDGNEQPLDLTGCTPRLYLIGADPLVFMDGTVTGKAAEFTLAAEAVAKTGLYQCQFLLTGPNDPPLKAGGLTLWIETSNLEGAAEATTEYSSLVNALNKAESAAADSAQAAKSSTEAVKTANAAADLANRAAVGADKAASDAKNLPYIGADDYWYLFNASSAGYEKANKKAAVTPRGNYDSKAEYSRLDAVYDEAGNASYLSLRDGNAAPLCNDGTNWALICRGIGVATDNNYTNADKAKVDAAVPQTLKIAGIDLSADRTAADLGLALGDASGSAQNALQLGGVGAAAFLKAESGTWVPTLYGISAAGTPSYSVKPTGWWYKIGKLVFLSVTFVLSSKGSMGGQINIGGLPFSAMNYGALCVSAYGGISISNPNWFICGNAIYSSIDASNWADTSAVYASTGFYIIT